MTPLNCTLVWSPRMTSKPPTFSAKSISGPKASPVTGSKPETPRWVMATRIFAPARLAWALALLAAGTGSVTSMVPKLLGKTSVGASGLVIPITPTLTPPTSKISKGFTPVRLSSTFFRLADTYWNGVPGSVLAGALAMSIICCRCAVPRSKLWLPNVSASKPMRRIARTAGSSSKKLDRGGEAP